MWWCGHFPLFVSFITLLMLLQPGKKFEGMGAYLAFQLFGAGVNMVGLSRKDHWGLKKQMIHRAVPFLKETLWVTLAQPVLTENWSSWRINQIF